MTSLSETGPDGVTRQPAGDMELAAGEGVSEGGGYERQNEPTGIPKSDGCDSIGINGSNSTSTANPCWAKHNVGA